MLHSATCPKLSVNHKQIGDPLCKVKSDIASDDWLGKSPCFSVPSLQIEGPVQVARRSDVDMNGHINNVTYLAWALETVPREVYYNYELEQVCQCTRSMSSALQVSGLFWSAKRSEH